MPIPQLKNKGNQNWRNNKKKYYLKRNRKSAVLNLKKTGIKRKRPKAGKLLTDSIKKKIFWIIFGFFIIGVFSVLILIAWVSRQLPDPNKLLERELAQSTKIYDRTGEEILYEIHGEEKRTLVSLDEIPDFLEWATISIEDKDFYKHKGFSLWAMFRTAITNVLRGQKAGGSTLTQQFIKNSMLTNEKTYIRKVKELLLAYKMEKEFTKNEILQMYLNEIPYGSTAYGIEAASQRYFGKSVRDINLAEASVLSALPQAPSRYSPYGSNKDLLLDRQKYILDLMVKYKYISEAQAEEAKNTELEFKKPVINIKAPHFVMYVKEILSEKYGEKTVEQGGLKIITTLDLYKQNIAEEVIIEHAEKNQEEYEASNASLVSIDPKTGQVLAMVGSKDYFNEEIDGQVNIATSLRQPGSSLKPLVYATAFLKGYTPDTILYDVVTNFSENKDEPYEPHNYNLKEYGPVSIRKALAGSLNIPAVKALYLADVYNVLDIAKKMGYSTLTERDRYGLSLVLGGGEVKLLEHVNAYGVFAREGILHPLSLILRIEDKSGKVLEEFNEEKEKVLDSKVARMINNVLSDNNARAYAFGESNWLTLGSRPVAAKTGTTNDYRDAWTIGYTPSIVTGVWVGNNDNTEMKRGAAGGVVAAPIWHDYMKKILGDTPVEYFKEPEIPKTGKPILDGEAGSATVIKIDKVSGLLASEHTPEELIEERTYFEPHCILYYVDKDDPLGEVPENPEKDVQFKLWEERVQEWAKKQIASSTEDGETIQSDGMPPTEIDNLHLPENIPQLSILSPGPNQTIMDPMFEIKIQTSSKRGVVKAEYYIDDNLFIINNEYPFNIKRQIDFLNNGFHNLKVRVCDDVQNCQTKSIEFNLVLEEKSKNQDINLNFDLGSNVLAINNNDFPFKIKLNTDNYIGIAKINLYYTSNTDSNPQYINTIQPVDNNSVEGVWENIPPSGTYKISAEGITWYKKSINPQPITLIINNINSSQNEKQENNTNEE